MIHFNHPCWINILISFNKKKNHTDLKPLNSMFCSQVFHTVTENDHSIIVIVWLWHFSFGIQIEQLYSLWFISSLVPWPNAKSQFKMLSSSYAPNVVYGLGAPCGWAGDSVHNMIGFRQLLCISQMHLTLNLF